MRPCSKMDFHGSLRNSLGFSRLSSTSCEIFLGFSGILEGICEVYMLDAAKKIPGICRIFMATVPFSRFTRPFRHLVFGAFAHGPFLQRESHFLVQCAQNIFQHLGAFRTKSVGNSRNGTE